MKTKLINRLLALRSFTLSVIVSVLMLATFSSSVSAQTAASSVSVNSAASSIPALTSQVTSNQPRVRKTFDHLKTGFALKGAHLSVTCETCHVGGTFKGTPKTARDVIVLEDLLWPSQKHRIIFRRLKNVMHATATRSVSGRQ